MIFERSGLKKMKSSRGKFVWQLLPDFHWSGVLLEAAVASLVVAPGTAEFVSCSPMPRPEISGRKCNLIFGCQN